MLRKTERLPRSDFLPFFKTGKRFHGANLSIVYTPYPTFHAAVVVSKKVSKLAVTRNTIRRRLYAQLRLLRTSKPGVYIVTVKPAFAVLTRKTMQQETKSLIERLQKSA